MQKRNPRAPLIALEEAVKKAARVYEKERKHAAPSDVVAQHIGYKSANNGAALSTLASLRYFGLLERPKEGYLAVSKDVETYQYAPNDALKKEVLKKWVSSPPVFKNLIEKYPNDLPSDGNLRFDLINEGFSPSAAENVIAIFKRSVAFAGIYDDRQDALPVESDFASQFEPENEIAQSQIDRAPAKPSVLEEDADRIPIRLPGGRRAWLIVPSPFYEADKHRLKAQIDLLLTDED